MIEIDVGAISASIIIGMIAIGIAGFLLGFFKGTFRSLLDLGFLILNIFLSVFVSSLIAKSVVNVELVSQQLPQIASSFGLNEELVDEISIYLQNPELASGVIAPLITLITVIAMPIIFMAVFFVLGIILFIPKIIIQIVILPKADGIGLRLGGGAIGTVVKVVALAVFLIPLVGYANYANDTIKQINGEMQAEEIGEVDGVLEKITDSFVIKSIYTLGGEALFDNLTTATVNDITVSLRAETNSAVGLVNEIDYFITVTPQDYGQNQVESIERIEQIINEAELVPTLLANTISYVASEWSNGNAAFGIEVPDVGADLQEAFNNTMNTLSTTTEDTFKEDLCTVAEIVKFSIEDGMIQAVMSENGNILYILQTTDIIGKILVEMHANDRMRPILPALTNGIVNYIYSIYDEVNGTTTEKHEMIDFDALSEETVRQEGKYISEIIVELDTFLKSIDGKMDGEIIELLRSGDFAALGRAFNKIKKSYLFCDSYEFLLKTVLESKGCAELGILDEQFIVNAIKHESDMEMMLVARQKITLMVVSMHDKEELDYDEAIEVILLNITSGDADSIKSIVSEENLNSIGIKGESAHTISGLLTSMVDSIKNENIEINSENVEKEAQSASKVITAMNSALENADKDKNVFVNDGDDKEATSNITASEFVSTTLESELVSSMVIGATKDEEGNVVEDPYNVKEHLSESDISEIEKALIDEYSKTEETDETKKEKLDAIAHIFGVDVSQFQ